MAATVIKAHNISKCYNLQLHYTKTLKGYFVDRKKSSEHNGFELWALKNISFELNKGECLGIIGPNGSGKSTLLKILSRVTEPTSGEVFIDGTVASVLEVGMGFHPELTGRENIYFNGSLLGMSNEAIDKQYNGIVEFSEIDKFIDVPVKYYSSGMFMRLAFSVVANINADILLFDEVMGVGDAAFQLKCQDKFGQLYESKKTMILVSHNLSDINRYCSRLILLDNGTIKEQGNREVIMHYFEDTLYDKFINDSGQVVKSDLEPSVLLEDKLSEKTEHEANTDTEVSHVNDSNDDLSEDKLPKQDANEAITSERKLHKLPPPTRIWNDPFSSPGNEFVRVHKISIRAEGKEIGEPIYIDDPILFEIEYERLIEGSYIGYSISCFYLEQLLLVSTPSINEDIHQYKKTGLFKATHKISSNFFNLGIFSFTFNFNTYIDTFSNTYFIIKDIFYIKIDLPVESMSSEKGKVLYSSFQCPIRPNFERYEQILLK